MPRKPAEPAPPRTIAIAGSSGLIGTALVAALRAEGRRVIRIVRRTAGNPDELSWNPDSGDFDPAGLDGVDAVVNMCGVGVGDRRWSGGHPVGHRVRPGGTHLARARV